MESSNMSSDRRAIDYENAEAKEWELDPIDSDPIERDQIEAAQLIVLEGEDSEAPSRSRDADALDDLIGSINLRTETHVVSTPKKSARSQAGLSSENQRNGGELQTRDYRGGILATRREMATSVPTQQQQHKNKKTANFARMRDVATSFHDKRVDQGFAEEKMSWDFTKDPSEDLVFPFRKEVTWPWRDQHTGDSMHPSKLLGATSQALNLIRESNRCFINFDVQTSCFVIRASNSLSVEIAASQIETAYKQQEAHVISFKSYHLLKPVRRLNSKVDLSCKLEKEFHGAFPRLWVQENTDTLTANHLEYDSALETLQNIILSSLERLKYYRGQLVMRVRFGMCFFTQMVNQQLSLDDFKSFLDKDDVDSDIRFVRNRSRARRTWSTEVTKLGKDSLKVIEPYMLTWQQLKTKLLKAEHILTSVGLPSMPLNQIKPDYMGIFLLKHSKPKGISRLRVRYYFDVADGTFQCERDWSRVINGNEDGQDLVRATWLDLERPSSWRFEIRTNKAQSKTSIKALEDFANTVHPKDDWNTGTPIFIHGRPPPNVTVLDYYEETSWKYSVRNTQYIIEVREKQRFSEEQQCIEVSSTKSAASSKSAWFVLLTNSQWDKLLDECSNLPVGQHVSWNNDVQTFFANRRQMGSAKSDSETFKDFIEILQQLEDIFLSDESAR